MTLLDNILNKVYTYLLYQFLYLRYYIHSGSYLYIYQVFYYYDLKWLCNYVDSI